jgi:hypothetical protein
MFITSTRFTALALTTLVALTIDPLVAQAQDNLSGVWMRRQPGNSFTDSPAPAMTPWAAALFDANRPTVGPDAALDANDPTLACNPPGLPYVLAIPTPFEFVRAPGQLIQLFEYNHSIRRIHTDGRPHPDDLNDTSSHEWMGHSVGRWEGDTLVVDTIGFNADTWLDRLGHPHSDALHVVERLRRLDADTLEYLVVVDDPKAYEATWEGRLVFERRADWEILEHACVTNDDGYARYKREAWAPPSPRQ